MYNMNGTLLDRCDQFKDLGIVVDNKLSFTPHIEYVTNSAMKMLGFIIRNATDLHNTHCIKLLFYTLIRAKLEYCSGVWNPTHNIYLSC